MPENEMQYLPGRNFTETRVPALVNLAESACDKVHSQRQRMLAAIAHQSQAILGQPFRACGIAFSGWLGFLAYAGPSVHLIQSPVP
jgi:hypothetical protein